MGDRAWKALGWGIIFGMGMVAHYLITYTEAGVSP